MRDDAAVYDASVVARLRAAGCVFAEDEAAVLLTAARSPAELDALVERRAAGEPLEQVVGWAEFAGLRIWVDPGVFVPRRRSEFLVSVAVGLARSRMGGGSAIPVIVDLCCGTGALGLGVAAGLTSAARAGLGRRAGSEPSRAGRARSNCTPPTLTRRPWRARGGTSSRSGGTSTSATCSARSLIACVAGWTS